LGASLACDDLARHSAFMELEGGDQSGRCQAVGQGIKSALCPAVALASVRRNT
jgi:hypothetical protein